MTIILALMTKYTYRQTDTDNFDARWDTPYGMIFFKKDSPLWASMVIDSGSAKQREIIESLYDLQEMLVMESGKSQTITIS